MKINFFRPEIPELRQFIERYYFLTREAAERPLTYIAFPGTGYFVTINEGVRVEYDDIRKTYLPDPAVGMLGEFIFNFDSPHVIQYRGAITELNICFKPLGINAFVDGPLRDFVASETPSFHPFPDFETYLEDVRAATSLPAKVRVSDDYWYSKLKGFAHPFLGDVLQRINDDHFRTIGQVAANLRISRTVLHREFLSCLGTTPAQYRRVVRFRRAMAAKSGGDVRGNLTDVSQLVNYFDQSHMVKDFKSLTNRSPKEFFDQLRPLVNGKLNWIFP